MKNIFELETSTDIASDNNGNNDVSTGQGVA